ncbi:MAG TPA: hypothetical protein VN457_00085, partial [Chlamydiales bacterium]|nr:hypothetical protein [Chlamydiales bacterium]
DPDGRFIVIERPVLFLNDIRWESDSNNLSDNDTQRVNQVARAVEKLVKGKIAPSQFRSDFLFVDADDSLKSVVPIVNPQKRNLPIGGEFHPLEQFVQQLSHGRLGIYAELMRRSQLRRHPLAQWYLKVVEDNVLNTSGISIIQQATIQGINDRHVVERAEEMVRELKQLQVDLVSAHAPRGISDEQRSEVARKIAKAFVTFQREFGSSASVWKDHHSFNFFITQQLR